MKPEQIQIGWFNINSRRFCYTDEKEFRPHSFKDYTWAVYAIHPNQNKVLEYDDKTKRNII